MDYLFRLAELRQRRNHRRVDTVQCASSTTKTPSKNHVFSKQSQRIGNSSDEIYNPIQGSTNVTVLKRSVDKNKWAAEPTKPLHYEIDSSFYFTVDFIAVL